MILLDVTNNQFTDNQSSNTFRATLLHLSFITLLLSPNQTYDKNEILELSFATPSQITESHQPDRSH